MIQAVLLIALGFLSASLIGVLIAPALWNRAYRLSRKRLEHTLPITLSEIEATQDQLRASYAVRMRRLETALASAKQKAAMQLVDNSRLQMQIGALKDQIADLDLKLSERRNAATVLEQTITRRFPELDREITVVKAQLQERSYALQDLSNKLSRRSEELEAAERAAASHRDELAKLQQALEKNSADRGGGRRLRRASQWSLDDYRAEYDRLNLDLSKLRQQLSQLKERDIQQASVIKQDLQKLAELILVSSQPKAEHRPPVPQDPQAKRAGSSAARRERPVPWPESIPPAPAPEPAAAATKESAASPEEQSQRQEPAADEGLATVFGAPPAPVPKEQSSSGTGERADSAPADPPMPRSSLLREAVPGKLVPNNGAAAREEGSAPPAAGTAAAPLREDAAPETVNGSGPEPDAARKESPDLCKDAEELAAKDERNGASPSRTLLERLRGAAGDTVEPGN